MIVFVLQCSGFFKHSNVFVFWKKPGTVIVRKISSRNIPLTVRTIIFRKVKSDFVTIDSLFEFHPAILKFVPWVKSVYLPDTDVLNEPENIKQESKKISETLKVHHVERFGVKVKVFLPSRGWATFLYPMVCKQERCCHLQARNCRC